METNKQICSTCVYGDGNWQTDSRNDIKTENFKKGLTFPTCEKCKADGWVDNPQEVQDAIMKDPVLGKIINVESPYFKK